MLNTVSTEPGAAQAPRRCDGRRTLSRWAVLWRRLSRRKIGFASLIVCTLVILVGAFGPLLAPNDPYRISLSKRLAPPSTQYPFGNDELGRCILSRIIHGARHTLVVGLVSVLIASVVGTFLGLVAGGIGGVVEGAIMRLTDLMLAFPWFLLVFTLVAALGPSLNNVALALGVWMMPHYVRLVRSVVLSIRETEFVQAAQVIGESKADVLLRYVLPNCVSPIIVQTTLDIPKAVMSGAALGFLGMGAPPPTPEWGVMISVARQYMNQRPHVLLFPALALMAVSLAFNLLGDSIRDVLDPRIQDVVE